MENKKYDANIKIYHHDNSGIWFDYRTGRVLIPDFEKLSFIPDLYKNRFIPKNNTKYIYWEL